MSVCRNKFSVCTVRASRINADGTFARGNTAGVVVACGGIGKLTYTPNIQTGEDIAEPDACGGYVFRKYDDQLKRFDVELDFLTDSYEMHEMFTGADLLTQSGTVVGYVDPVDVNCGGAVTPQRIALEAWSENIDCDGTPLEVPYSVHVFPYVKFKPDVRTLEKGLSHYTLKGFSVPNDNFSSGPFRDLFPLIGVTGWAHAELNAAALPACGADCGYDTLPYAT